jgi:hypothetical protein
VLTGLSNTTTTVAPVASNAIGAGLMLTGKEFTFFPLH